MDPITALILGGLGLAGGVARGMGQAAMSNADRREAARQFNLMQGLRERGVGMGEAEMANDLRRQAALSPMRDRVAYNINARLGMPSAQFAPQDMFNPRQTSQVSQGGIDQNALGSMMGQYQQGAGGQMDPSWYNTVLQQLGYTQQPQSGRGTEWVRESPQVAQNKDQAAKAAKAAAKARPRNPLAGIPNLDPNAGSA